MSDLLTSLSILAAVITGLIAWLIDRSQRKREYADKVREAASVTLSKVDRGQMIFLSFFQWIQPLITEIDGTFVRTKDFVLCRDRFWQELHNVHIRVLEKFDEEEIELSYGPLMSHQADVYDLFASSVAAAKSTYNFAFMRFLATSQNIILSCRTEKIQSAELGNALRNLANNHEVELKAHLGGALSNLTKLLRTIVQLDDRKIRDRQLVASMITKEQKDNSGRSRIQYFLDKDVFDKDVFATSNIIACSRDANRRAPITLRVKADPSERQEIHYFEALARRMQQFGTEAATDNRFVQNDKTDIDPGKPSGTEESKSGVPP